MRQEPMNTGGTYWSRFRIENLKPGDRACCPYTSFDCDRNNKPDDMTLIAFKAYFEGVDKGYIFTVNLPSGGWLEFHGGGPQDPDVHVFNPDGSPFKHEFQKNVKGLLLN
ncbi:hypothetical protein INT46_000521 [Mucor plumbeus]|uniref:Uncharacterized protein n=1 Tax=Mucor plumbeus TaxID=97098 RepID=A0A8H7R2G1_9FUNG|nr:hypothetical protein INT46_000521 [Mucor plumbeus]